ncbi:MAG: AAA family ATPase [Bacteroidales bacterium]|nr:AAA family ATPase [Bacteroidales bacterium]
MHVDDALRKYAADFPINWPKEEYKWRALKCFQDNWNIDKADFAGMLERSLSKSDNLLGNSWEWPARFLVAVARLYPEEVRAMFRKLYDDGNDDIADRVDEFIGISAQLYEKVKDKPEFSAYKDHFQKIGAVSVYLWLRFPDKFSVYKYKEYSSISRKLGLGIKTVQGNSGEALVHNWEIMEILHGAVSANPDIKALMNEKIAGKPSEYAHDPAFRTLAQDFGFWISRYYEPSAASGNENVHKPAFWIARMSEAPEDVWENALSGGYWCTQQRYEHQTRSAVTNLLNIVTGIRVGDVLLLTYGKEIRAYGIVRKCPFSTGQVASIAQTVENGEHEFDSGKVEFSDSDVFYEDLTDGTDNWGQRIYVGEWRCYSDPSGVTTEGTAKAVMRGITQQSVFGISSALGKEKMNSLIRQYEEKYAMIRKITRLLRHKKNIILQGAPGTGKTYNTAAIALSVLGTDSVDLDNHEAVMKKYKELVAANRICFTTFHQSMDYEDFVEGFKPVPSDAGALSYEVEDGIFKSLCLEAQSKSEDNFPEAYGKLCQAIADSDKPYPLVTPTGTTFHVRLNSNRNLSLLTGKEQNWNGSLTKEKIRGYAEQQDMDYYWRGYYMGVVKCLVEKFGYKAEKREQKDYVLIIDEINRGNVSKIFGELITLLESDKRSDGDHQISVTLPYSKQSFSVPSNLYIIGTMNTTDRSTGTIDYAVRRRFAFVTLPADKEAIQKDGPARDLFDNVQEFIRKYRLSDLSLDDLMVGHSYFMVKDDGVNATDEILKLKMEYEVIPLVSEYIKDGILNVSKDEAEKYFDAWRNLRTVSAGKPADDEDDSQG